MTFTVSDLVCDLKEVNRNGEALGWGELLKVKVFVFL